MIFQLNSELNFSAQKQNFKNPTKKFLKIENTRKYLFFTDLKKKYQLDKPKGVRGRSSNNVLIKKILNWSYGISLKDGLTKTYKWIESEMTKKGSNLSRFTKS